jgi:hypothetical protein
VGIEHDVKSDYFAPSLTSTTTMAAARVKTVITRTMKFTKISSSARSEDTTDGNSMSKTIYSGDVVTIQVVNPNPKSAAAVPAKYLLTPEEGKLAFVDTVTGAGSHCHFRVSFLEDKPDAEDNNTLANPSQRLPIDFGQPVRITSVLWPDFKIGFTGKSDAQATALALQRRNKAKPLLMRLPSFRKNRTEETSKAAGDDAPPRQPIVLVPLSRHKRTANVDTTTGTPGTRPAPSLLSINVEGVLQMVNRLTGEVIAAYSVTYHSTLPDKVAVATAFNKTETDEPSSSFAAQKTMILVKTTIMQEDDIVSLESDVSVYFILFFSFGCSYYMVVNIMTNC